MNSQGILAIGLFLIVSFNVCSAQMVVKHTNVTTGVRKGYDRLLGQETKAFVFASPQDVTKTVTYSAAFKITQVTFDVETNSNHDVVGNVVSGGIGQKQIAVVLQAKSVTSLKYTVFVYGNSAALMPSLGLVASFVAYIIFVNKQ